METKLDLRPLEAIEGDVLVVIAFEEQEGAGSLPIPNIAEFYDGQLLGKLFEMTMWPQPAGLKTKHLLIAGGGKRDRFTSSELRKLAGAAVRFLKPKSLKDVAFALDSDHLTDEAVAAAVEGAMLGDFEPDRYKSDRNDAKRIERFTLVALGGHTALETALRRGSIIAESQNLARELANEPPNRLGPMILAERARQTAAEAGIDCEILNQDRMKQLGMGALLGVAMGSAEPPALIIMRYRPPTSESAVHLALIGKGVTFDTGGISIKPADGMEKMKYDMSGGAAVIGAMRAIAQLQPCIAVTGLIPAVENMPGSRAQRPGDIVTSLSGKTIEVINTDAEGRLILADALTYAQRLGCTHLIDAATLTGAIVVSLGHVNIGVFGNDESLMERVMQAARAEGEKMWRMPLDDEYREPLKSPFADIQNVGGRWGGAVTAAMFLKEFADPKPWTHLDIAGTAWLEEAKPFMAKGPSGVCVRTFVNVAVNWT